MFLDKDHGILHVHIPKCAGSAIQATLISNTKDYIQNVPGLHRPANMIREMIGEDRWSLYYKFAVVRNPFEWYVSMWKFLTPFDTYLFRDSAWRTVPPFERLGQQQGFIHGTFDHWLENFQWTLYSYDRKTSINRCAQLDWVNDDIELWDIQNLEGLRATIHRETGLDLNIPRTNVTPDYGDYRQYYSPWSRAYVEDLNQPLLDRMDYSFDDVSEVAA